LGTESLSHDVFGLKHLIPGLSILSIKESTCALALFTFISTFLHNATIAKAAFGNTLKKIWVWSEGYVGT